MHVMDAASRYSVGAVVEDTSMRQAIVVLDAHWVTPFWTPDVVAYDSEFKNSIFINYLKDQGIDARPLPSRRHNKNVLESKHRIIRDVFLRLKEEGQVAEDDCKQSLCVQQAIRISNDLYGNDVLSAQELAKGYSRPLESGVIPKSLSQDLIDAHQTLLAKRKLTLILRSKTFDEIPIAVGDLVQVFIKKQNQKRGKWSQNKPVLAYDFPNRTITVPGSNGRKICAAIEDVRPAIRDNELAAAVQDAIDEMDRNLDEVVEEIVEIRKGDDEQDSNQDDIRNHQEPDDEIDCIGTNLPNVGDQIEVYWPLDKSFYGGTVEDYDEQIGKHSVKYFDGDEEHLNLQDEVWNRVEDENAQDGGRIEAAEVELTPGQELQSSERELIKKYFEAFGHAEFMLHQAQGLPPFATRNAYEKEEKSFKKTVTTVTVSQVPKDANIVTSHVLYKVKKCDDASLTLKARIAVHGNKDRDKDILKTDSATCPPVGIRILLSLATIYRWIVAKIDFKSAYLQTEAERNVYIVPPRECKTRYQQYWLLLSAAYGLANAGAKWQQLSDDVLRASGFKQLVYVPQLFYKEGDGKTVIVAVKVVDDILFAGEKERITEVIENIKKQYKLGTIVYGPGKIQLYGLMITQDEDMTIMIDADEKMQGYHAPTISRLKRKEQDTLLNGIELASFRSLNSCIGWLGVAASPFCAFTASYLQQKGPAPYVKDMVTQINLLNNLKKRGTSLRFTRPVDNHEYEANIVVFSDASRITDYGQLGFVAGLLFGKLEQDAVIHVVSWSSHKSRRPVKSIGAAETLAAGEAIDEGKVLSKAFKILLGIQVGLWVVVDSKDLHGTLSTCRNAADRSIRGDVSVIRYEFETRNVDRMIWVPGRMNYADPLTKTDSPLSSSLELMLFTGKITMDFGEALSSSSNKSTG